MAETTDIQRLVVQMEANYNRLQRELGRANQIASQSAKKIQSDFATSNRGVIAGFASMTGGIRTQLGRGVMGEVSKLRSSLFSLISPVGLITTAVATLGGAAIGWLTSMVSSTDDTKEVTERLTERVERLRDAYGEAKEAQRGFSETERLGSLLEATNDLASANRALDFEMRNLQNSLDTGSQAQYDLFASAMQGIDTLEQLGNALRAQALAASDPATRELATDLANLVSPANSAQQQVAQLEAQIAVLNGTANAAQLALLGLGSAMDRIVARIPAMADAARVQGELAAQQADFEAELASLAASNAAGEFAGAAFGEGYAHKVQELQLLNDQAILSITGVGQAVDDVLSEAGDFTLDAIRAGMDPLDRQIADLERRALALKVELRSAINELDATGVDTLGNRSALQWALDNVDVDLDRQIAVLREANDLRIASAGAANQQAEAVDGLTDALDAEAEALERSNALLEKAEDAIANALDRLIVQGDSLREVMADLLKQFASSALRSGIDMLFGMRGSGGGAGGGGIGSGALLSALLGSFGGARAMGGPVSPGRSYLVGERGPEFLVPRMPAMVIPANRGTSTNVQVRIDLTGANGDATIRRIAYEASAQGVKQALRLAPGHIARLQAEGGGDWRV